MNLVLDLMPRELKTYIEKETSPNILGLWASTHLKKDVKARVSLVDMHKSYEVFATGFGFVPLKKLVFSAKLREHFNKQITRGEIYVNNVSKVYYEGLSLTESLDFDNVNLK